MPPGKRKPKSSKRATRRSPQKPRPPKTAKSSCRKSKSRLPKKVAVVRPLPVQPEEILFRVEGKMSTLVGFVLSVDSKKPYRVVEIQNPTRLVIDVKN